jgi:L-threonylcarbamoyladenylate synthase
MSLPMDTKILNTDMKGIKTAAAQLRAGELVAFPTETVYGLGADARNDKAIARIYAAKGRPSFNPLIVHFFTTKDVGREVRWNSWGEKLATAFWPGPVTFILPRSEDCQLSLLVSAGLNTIAVRVPAHEIAHKLIEKADCAIAAPSANASGKISPTTAAHVKATLLGKIPYILDGGVCTIGLESTVLDLSGDKPNLLRPGAITQEEIETIVGPISVGAKNGSILSPGMLERHYAPDVPIRLNATEFSSSESILGFGPSAPTAALNLSSSKDLVEAAANLFVMLHALDQAGAKPIAVMPIPETGLGLAINDRLRRAATRE